MTQLWWLQAVQHLGMSLARSGNDRPGFSSLNFLGSQIINEFERLG